MIALNEEHLRRLLHDYVTYHHEDRLHDSLEKDTPNRRRTEQRPGVNTKMVSVARLGGLHHSVHVGPGRIIGTTVSIRVEDRCRLSRTPNLRREGFRQPPPVGSIRQS